jgi:hypothetical protein
MKILVFAATTTAIQSLAIGRLVKGLREAGHSVGERSLPHFRLESEPADKIVFALTHDQAVAYHQNGVEVAQTFGGPDVDLGDLFVQLELTSDPAELEQETFEDFIDSFADDDVKGYISLETAKAQAIERGLEVTPSTTREEFEHMLGVDIHPGRQAADRVYGLKNDETGNERRIGFRTSSILPNANGLDLVRMNDEQLKATAAQLGLRVPTNVSRETLVNKITQTYNSKIGAEDIKGVQSPDGGTTSPGEGGGDGNGAAAGEGEGEADGDVVDINNPCTTIPTLKGVAEKEGVDLTGLTAKDDIVAAIAKARADKGNG